MVFTGYNVAIDPAMVRGYIAVYATCPFKIHCRPVITPLRKYDLHRESSGIPDVLAVEETLDHMGLPLAAVQV